MDAAEPTVTFVKSRGMLFPKAGFLTGRPRKMLRLGAYEEREADAALSLVKPGDRVLELGAGIGFMSTLVATKRRVASVHCYEANPKLVRYIREVHVANGVVQAEVHNAVMAAESGPDLTFYERENFLASSLDKDSDPDSIVGEHAVARALLPEALERSEANVLICDIEGAESDVLPTADLSQLRAAVIELHPQWVGQSGVQAVFDAFHSAGLTYVPKASSKKVVAFAKGW